MLVLGLTGYAPVAAVGEVLVSINAPDRVVPGSNFTATVNISQVVELNGVQYDIVFDPLALRLVNVTPGKVGSTTMPVQGFTMVSPGRYRVLQFLMLNKVSGAGYLAVLHFQVVGSPGGSSIINLANGILSGLAGEIPSTWIDDSVSIGSAETPGAPAAEGSISQPAGNEGSGDSTATVSAETPGAPATEGSISQPAGNEGSGNSAGIVSAESDGEEVAPAIPPSLEATASPSPEAAPSPSPEAAPAKPVNWLALWGVIAGVLVVGLLVFLQVRRRHY